ncbi:triose-phosphate isomerase [Leptospira bourretii]|uniref:Triosephosphate isomerase n=1 Tax=Leptospira bourretii TaxID=2484962 RepID=A0A4R9IJL1_9LEPT|nr:triose-phosphate isomerase [Leptospira bourretii]TGK79371.1 triose-phosphate isomerase [Leptospira bourretii]TGK89577.1 triose-phosphate isomerase [Leptospira bourretii]TGL19659.1 triose-phosphate isomerase [Leptospira bourretii]TGL30608.1 triose-phosphate isomerase [Leptospira bourretii]
MRKKIIAGNWKMNLTLAEASAITKGLVSATNSSSYEVMVFPSALHLETVSSLTKGSKLIVGAQNAYQSGLTAMTGEISPTQLKEIGIQTVLVGHSERRQFLGETSEFDNQKILFFLKAGLRVVYCVGETWAEREKGNTFSVLEDQIKKGLKDITSDLFSKLVIAYEPVWAIGTGKVATPVEAEEAHAFIRKEIGNLFVGAGSIAENIQILYGGSVKPDNIKELLAKPNIDGGLVGGASQKLDSFLGLLK